MSTIEAGIRLVERGLELFQQPRAPVSFAGDPVADALINDLDTRPHAFLLAGLMDRQIKAERAWAIPQALSERLGGFDFPRLSSLSLAEVREHMTTPQPLHRFPDRMSEYFYSAVRIIEGHYDGDASQLWEGKPSSAEVVYRFLQFPGVGPKIATMAANILARDFKVPFSDHYSIDVSADVHVRRVFCRLGFTEKKASIEEVIYKGRALNPEFPGLLDLPAWEIGRNWCRSRTPACSECYMQDVCRTAATIDNSSAVGRRVFGELIEDG